MAPGRSIVVDMGRHIAELVHELLRTGPDTESPIVDALLKVGEPALPVLAQVFPGPVWVDWRLKHRRRPRAEEASPVARALRAFGRKAVPYVASLLSEPDPVVRYYALLVASEIPHARLLGPLYDCVFDDEPRVRGLAREVLAEHRGCGAPFRAILGRLQQEACDENEPSERRLRAIEALATVRDPGAVGRLIGLLQASEGQLGEAAHEALVQICCRDFGRSVRKWRSWWARNQGRHRIEWLIDALNDTSYAVRAQAGKELAELTQQYFGYHPAMPSRDREVCQRKYKVWWEREGRVRFRGTEDSA